MSFLSITQHFDHVTFLGDDHRPLVPLVLHIPGSRRSDLAGLRVSGPAVYVALYADGIQAYVGVSGDYPTRAGEGFHLAAFGEVESLFVVTEAEDRWTLDEARAAERIIWETLNEIAGLETIGLIPRGAPMAECYGQIRAFCGRALQVIAGSGLALTDIPQWSLLAGATGNADILAEDSESPITGDLYSFTGKGISAQAVETEEGEWILLAGSEICASPVPSAGQLLRVRLESLLYAGCVVPHPDDRERYVTRRHLVFSSPSAAAQVVAGSKGYGPAGWRRLRTVRNSMPSLLPRLP